MAGLFFSGRIIPPWEELPEVQEGEEPPAAPRVNADWTRLWGQACESTLLEQVYLLTSRAGLTEDRVMDMPNQERVLWVVRTLMDVETEAKRYNNLLDVMIKLWSAK